MTAPQKTRSGHPLVAFFSFPTMDDHPIEELEVSGCGDLVISEDGTIRRISGTYFTRCRRSDGGRRLEIALDRPTGPEPEPEPRLHLDDDILFGTLRRVHLSGHVKVTFEWAMLSTESVHIETRNTSELVIRCNSSEWDTSESPRVTIRAHERSTVTCRGNPRVASSHVHWRGLSRVTFYPDSLGDNVAKYQ